MRFLGPSGTLALGLCAAACPPLAWSIQGEGSQPSAPSWLFSMLLPTALGEAKPPAHQPTTNQQQETTARLKTWLEQQGADISHIDFKESKVGPEAGVGVFVPEGEKPLVSRPRRWWAPWWRSSQYALAAAFPLSIAITAENVLSNPQLGSKFRWLLEHDVMDERQLVQCYLAVEKARGRTSPLAPWLDALPCTFHSPLMWSEAELSQLRGTTLAGATHRLRARLAQDWQQLQEPLARVARELGAPRPPTLADLMWAHCVFWSRGQSLPVPVVVGAASELVAHHQQQQQDAGGTTAGDTSQSRPPITRLLHVHEGIVPGLDFVNHRSPGASCWWDVHQGQPHSTGTTAPDKLSLSTNPLSTASVRLQLHEGSKAHAGDELTISYDSNRSNESLLLLYGFVSQQGMSRDQVMVACPVPPAAQWDELMAARMELLTSSGMRPQFFLSATNILSDSAGGVTSQGSTSSGSSGSNSAEVAAAHVPGEVLEALEVFVLEPREVKARLEGLQAQQRARRQGYSDAAAPPVLSGAHLDLDAVARSLKQRGPAGPQQSQLEALSVQLGLRMAALSTYARLLEVQLVELEGAQQGTGSLEEDMALLAAHKAAAAAAAAGAAAGADSQEAGQTIDASVPGLLPYRTWCAVVYRAGQKRVLRAHVLGARAELQQVMGLLSQVQDLLRPQPQLSCL